MQNLLKFNLLTAAFLLATPVTYAQTSSTKPDKAARTATTPAIAGTQLVPPPPPVGGPRPAHGPGMGPGADQHGQPGKPGPKACAVQALTDLSGTFSAYTATNGEATTVCGTISSLCQDPKSRTQALVLSDGTVLHLPPPAAKQLSEKLKVGTIIAATAGPRKCGAAGWNRRYVIRSAESCVGNGSRVGL